MAASFVTRYGDAAEPVPASEDGRGAGLQLLEGFRCWLCCVASLCFLLRSHQQHRKTHASKQEKSEAPENRLRILYLSMRMCHSSMKTSDRWRFQACIAPRGTFQKLCLPACFRMLPRWTGLFQRPLALRGPAHGQASCAVLATSPELEAVAQMRHRIARANSRQPFGSVASRAIGEPKLRVRTFESVRPPLYFVHPAI
ncbi:unnamed protein product [Symbiodinium natans]|uniref:Uncharacterized protein n=1 Tax=Symbiodinium natans TaxID=878477 RepID=A0A812M2E0_9DINO|nr:unnamed protein product [Symbiodinium natans]